MEQAPVQIGQFILGKNLGIGAFGKVRYTSLVKIGSKKASIVRSLRQKLGFARIFTRELLTCDYPSSCL